jgi:galactitol-specific phosphotransferase system IIB component
VKTIKFVAVVSTLAIMACGGGMDSSSEVASKLAAYQALGQQVETTVTAYGAETATLADVAACETAHARYEAAMAGMVEPMRQMSAELDQHMDGMGHGGFDMGCVADALAAEFEHHHAEACTGADVAADEQAAASHVATMDRFVEHQRMRYEDAGTSMGMMGPHDGTTFTCEENADGSFTLGGETWTPGTPVPGSGTCTGDACGHEPCRARG